MVDQINEEELIAVLNKKTKHTDYGEKEAREQKGLVDEWLSQLASDLNPDASDKPPLWMPQPGPQTMAFESQANELFYGGAAGGGKLFRNITEVLTPFGWKKASEVKVSDMLIAGDGTATKVLAVYPHQDIDIYKITFIDGATVEVGADHLWFYWYSSTRLKADRRYILYSPEKGVHYEDVRGRMGLTKDLYKYHKKQVEKQKGGGRPYWIITPLCDPIRFTRPSQTRQGETIRIDPYLLGLLLGDGAMTDSGVSITNIDEEIKNYVMDIAKDDVVWDNKKQLRFRGSFKVEVQKQLESYGLWNHKANNKFIPENYLFADINTRFDLIAGMIDTDGYIDDRGHISYTTISEQLAKDVQHLARSLGCKAGITSKVPTYTYKGEKLKGQLAYTVWIQGEIETLKHFSKLPRKRDNIKPYNGGVSEAGRRVTDIEYIGKDDGVCFAIDHPQGLHVVQDFIVTHNTDLLLGLAVSQRSPHRKSVIFRREFSQLKDVILRSQEVLAQTGAKFNSMSMMWNHIPGNKTLELGSVPHEAAMNKYKGRPHDLKLFDEASDFSITIYEFLSAWARSTIPGMPVRIVCAGNPPTHADGEWVIQRWAPWIDPQYPNPAVPGELRWFAKIEGEEKECENADSFEWKGELVIPRSRTFVPAKLDDNLYLSQTDYRSVLINMPEPLRSQLLYGDFGLSLRDDPWQVIPMLWVRGAHDRWNRLSESGELQKLVVANVAYGLDVAEAGKDMTVLVKITGSAVQWVKQLKERDIMKQVDWVVGQMSGNKHAPIGVDAIGIGSGLASRLRQLGFRVVAIKASNKARGKDPATYMPFHNLRSQMWWGIRNALNPEYNSDFALPPDRLLTQELTSPLWEGSSGIIRVQSTDEIKHKIGRSPDRASALMLGLFVSSRSHVPLRMA